MNLKKNYCAISYWIFLTETKIFNSNWEVLSLQVIKKDEKFLAPERWVSWLVRLRRMLNRRIFFVWWISFQFFGEVGELAETNGLLNRRTGNTVPRVRISPSPQLLLNRNDYIVWFLPISTDFLFIFNQYQHCFHLQVYDHNFWIPLWPVNWISKSSWKII